MGGRDTVSDPRSLLRPLIAALRSPAQRRSFAADLRALADEQERLADADERAGPALRRARIETYNTTKRTGRPKGTGARFLRWEPPRGEGKASRRSGQFHIGRALDQELGEPERLDVQRVGTALRLRPCGAGVGWKVSRPANGMPRLNIGEEAADTLRLEERRYPARIESGVIVTE